MTPRPPSQEVRGDFQKDFTMKAGQTLDLKDVILPAAK
jgi:hypothetical protein